MVEEWQDSTIFARVGDHEDEDEFNNHLLTEYSETWAWDVRNKHVAYEPVPTVEGVLGLACFGPQATLFSLGPKHTVQQYDMNPPALVKNVRHDPHSPASINSTPKTSHGAIPGAAPPSSVYKPYESGRGPASLSTIQRATNEMHAVEHARQVRRGMASPMSTASRTESISSRSSAGLRDRAPSVSAASGTTFSTVSPSMIARESIASPFWPHSVSVTSSSRRSKGSRLRHEITQSPVGNIVDLFPYARARLATLPYAPQPSALDQITASPSDLRRQMLRVVFGWDGDIEPMIRDELSHHPAGSMNATLLAKWLGEVNFDMMSTMGSDCVTSTDWMMLALTNMGADNLAAQHMGRNFAQKLLQQADIHTAATVFIGLKDFDDAVDIYVSRNYFMEAILLTCLLFPEEWQRQAHLVRRWGEYVVENSQQHLAIRCFSCTGADTSVPWASPMQSPFMGTQPTPSVPQTLSPPTSPPLETKPSRMTSKNSSLKLITSFGPSEKSAFRFPGLKTDDRTPTNAPGVTPIQESAISPGGNTPGSFLRPGPRSKTPGGHRSRLPSIGETPVDVNPPHLPITVPKPLPTPNDSGSDKEKEQKLTLITKDLVIPARVAEDYPLTLSATRYDPREDARTPQVEPRTAIPGATPQTAIPSSAQRVRMPSNSDKYAMANTQERSRTRNGSRDRKPTGLHITTPALSQLNLNAIATSSSNPSPLPRRGPSSMQSGSSVSGRLYPRSELISPAPGTGQSWASSTKSPSVSGRSIDQYISSLEEAQFHAQKRRERRREHRSREGRGEHKSRSKVRRGQGEEHVTEERYVRPAKRSPSSPVPMSPEDLQRYRDTNSASVASTISRDSSPETAPHVTSSRRREASKNRSHSKMSDMSHRTTRRVSPGHDAIRVESRRASPERLRTPIDSRGRSRSKTDGSILRSPSSPLPMSPQAALYQSQSDDYVDDSMRIVEANRERLRSRQRNTSRRPRERAASSSRSALSMERRLGVEERQFAVSDTSQKGSPKTSDFETTGSDGNGGSRLSRSKSHRSLKKEAAARELEARRESLTARTMASVTSPVYLHPRPDGPLRTQSDMSVTRNPVNAWNTAISPDQMTGYSDHSVPTGEFPADDLQQRPIFGLPATPRAMRHPRYGSRDEDIPAVPELPDAFYATGQPMHELPRSMSAPVPEPDGRVPYDMPTHSAYQRNVRPSTKRPNFSPLNEIGKQRRSPSIDSNTQPPVLASIGETLHAIAESTVIDVPVSSNTPPAIIPELAHLASPLPPPPPPPPPFRDDNGAHHSLSSGSGVGTINIVMDEDSRSTTPVIDVGPPRPPAKVIVPGSLSPLPPLPLSSGGRQSPPMSGNSITSCSSVGYNPIIHGGNISGNGNGNGVNSQQQQQPLSGDSMRGHRRGRSIDHFGTKITRMADRMRSTSRGPHNTARVPKPVDVPGPSPYETRFEHVEGQAVGQYF